MGENYHSTQASETCYHLVDWVTLGDKAIYWLDSLETASRPINCLETVLGPINHLETVPGPIAVFQELFLLISATAALQTKAREIKHTWIISMLTLQGPGTPDQLNQNFCFPACQGFTDDSSVHLNKNNCFTDLS